MYDTQKPIFHKSIKAIDLRENNFTLKKREREMKEPIIRIGSMQHWLRNNKISQITKIYLLNAKKRLWLTPHHHPSLSYLIDVGDQTHSLGLPKQNATDEVA